MRNFSLYKSFIRPFLFAISKDDQELAHELAKPALASRYAMKAAAAYLRMRYGGYDEDRLRVRIKGIEFPNTVGTAAGFDKDAEMIEGMDELGFGFLTIGTALPHSWPGFDRRRYKRLFRDVRNLGMRNRMGFPFKGYYDLRSKLESYRGSTPLNLSISLRPTDGEDQTKVIEQFLERIPRLTDYKSVRMVELNFASPNTQGLAVFMEPERLDYLSKEFIKRVRNRDDKLLLLKMPPHDVLKPGGLKVRDRNLRSAEVWIENSGDGLTAINTVPIQDPRLPNGGGGESGKPIYYVMLDNVEDYRERFGDDIVISAVGGIWPKDIPAVLRKADLVQTFTGFIYEGPHFPILAERALLEYLDKKNTYYLRTLRRSYI